MNQDVENFLDELRADKRTRPSVEPYAKALRAMDLEADGNADAAGLIEVMSAIMRGPGSLDARIETLGRLSDVVGYIAMTRDGSIYEIDRLGRP